jgi:hypothetical protein
LDGLRRALERYTGVPAGAQILMTSFGTQVKQDMVKDVVQATGKVRIGFAISREIMPSMARR